MNKSVLGYWTKERIVQTIIWLVAFVGFAVFIICIVGTIHKRVVYSNEIEYLNTNIEQLNKNIQVLANHKPVENNKTYTALTAGNNVASIQNAYYQIESQIQTGVTTTGEQDIETNNQKLASYFSDDSAYNQENWYYCSDLNYRWTFNTVYSFVESELCVLWTCYNTDSNEMLAYATAIYNSETDKFHDLHCYVTHTGYMQLEPDIDVLSVNVISDEVSDDMLEDGQQMSEIQEVQ